MRRSAPNISDVAKLAGVSVATVSRTLASPASVRSETRSRVLKAVEATGYVPNAAARNLRMRRTGTILAVVPDGTNVFFPRILRSISQAIEDRGYTLVVADTQNDPVKEARVAHLAASGQVDGMLLLNGKLISERRGRTGKLLPMVSLCESIPGSSLPHVETGNREAARTMTEYLVGLGHRRIGYVRGPTSNILEHQRFEGYTEALEAAKLPLDEKLIRQGDFSIDAGERAAESYLASKALPDAIFACNDATAMGLIRAFSAAGIRVPQDISVAGFDDIEFATAYNPGLTTMHQDRQEIGRRAAMLLIDLVEGRELPARAVSLPASLIIRESTAPPIRASRRQAG